MNRPAWLRRVVLGVGVAAAFALAATLDGSRFSKWRPRDAAPISAWLTEPDPEQLAEAVTSAVERYGWAAGCLWPSESSEDRLTAVTQLGFQQDDEWVLINARHLKSGALMLLLRHPGPTGATGSFNEKNGNGFFCYVPEEKPRYVPSA